MKSLLRAVDVVKETDDLIFVSKPSGLLSIPDRYDQSKPNLLDYLRSEGREVFAVHRLDRDTSGIMVFAKTPEAHKELNQQFEHRISKKIYWALVMGALKSEGEISLPIVANPNRPGAMKIAKKGKESVSRYRVIEEFANCSLVELEPLSGRTHQLRVHMMGIGHPLLIDPIYGSDSGIYLSRIKPRYRQKRSEEERPIMDRLTLHARSLTILDPQSGSEISENAELPKDFRVVLDNLRKYQAR